MAPSTPHSYRAHARRRWPKAEMLGGFGPWATVSGCPPIVTVELHPSEAAAGAALAAIDRYACGSRCRRQHAVYDLRQEGGAATPAGGRR